MNLIVDRWFWFLMKICGVCGMVMNNELLKKEICCFVFSFFGIYSKGFLVFRVVCSFFKFLKKCLLFLFGSFIVFMNSLVFLLFWGYEVCVLIFFRKMCGCSGKLCSRFLYKF